MQTSEFDSDEEVTVNEPVKTMKELMIEFEARWRALVADEGIKVLGASPTFKALRADCAAHGLKPCSSRVCSRPIKLLDGFSKHRKMNDGLMVKCRDCNNDPAAARASGKRKLEHREALEVVKVFDSIGVEDEARIWLLEKLHEHGIEATGTLEFRKADVAVRLPNWPAGLWLRVQLKADGVYKDDGKTPKPKEWSSKGGGRAHFNDCDGYEGMLVVFVKSRFDADGKTIVRRVWFCNGGDDVGSHKPNERAKGTLGPNRIALGSVDAFVTAIGDSTLPRMTLEEINLEVTMLEHRKEATIMIALRAACFVVEFEPGNQTAVDCLVNGVPTQVKTYNLDAGQAEARHRVNGKQHQAYGALDGIKQLLEAVIVKSGGMYFLLYAIQPHHALLYNGIFAHLTPFRGKPSSPGSTTISPPLQIYEKWLTGDTSTQTTDKRIAWLNKPAYNWSLPVELKPGEYGIPPQWLEEAAQEAKCPSAFPSQAKLDVRKTRIEESESSLAKNAEENEKKILELQERERDYISQLNSHSTVSSLS